ncbi:MAG TPA: hypothetical protein VKM54_18595, partial [Myxococcota bacterium]|nr:hypothetical protein [Myxococcota bacterium]
MSLAERKVERGLEHTKDGGWRWHGADARHWDPRRQQNSLELYAADLAPLVRLGWLSRTDRDRETLGEALCAFANGTVAICVGIDWRGLRSGEDTGSGSKVNRLIGEFLGQGLPAVDFAHGD